MQPVVLTEGGLTIEEVCRVADGAAVEIHPDAKASAKRSREALERLEESGQSIYGVNTGFGPLKSVVIPPNERVHLQENLIRSHAMGVGVPLESRDVRAAMLLTAATHLRGRSGVDGSAAERIVRSLNDGDEIRVPSRGSLGASGDLAPLAHIALHLAQGIDPPLTLTSKLGLSLINGTHVHTGIAARLIPMCELLARAADVACAMNLEAMLCSRHPFRQDVHNLRPHPHQIRSASNIRRLIEGSALIESHANCDEIQDAYSIRCAPQVHGAARQAVAHAREVVEIELQSVTDNPLVIGDEVVSAGHFHGEPVGLALDYLKIGVSELGAISERRSERALNKDYNRGLPAFLVQEAGLNSGMMICQYTAAALVSENKVLCHPSCVDSITTGANQEDHVSMAMNAALHAKQVVANVQAILSIELVVAAQALDARAELESASPGNGVVAAWKAVRGQVAPLTKDRSLSEEIENLDLSLIVQAASQAVGGLD